MTKLALAVIAMVPLTLEAGGAQDRPTTERTPQEARSICEDARRLARLARIDDSPDADTIRTQAEVWCAARETRSSLTWSNKKNARLPSGAWHYPNGRSAKTSGGLWHYPGGRTARVSSGVWSYPNGRTAKFESGRWQRPDGQTATEAQLMIWACEKVADGNCRRRLSEISALSGFDKELAIIELAWSGR